MKRDVRNGIGFQTNPGPIVPIFLQLGRIPLNLVPCKVVGTQTVILCRYKGLAFVKYCPCFPPHCILGECEKFFPHPFRCTLEQPNAAQYTIITISIPIMLVNLFVRVLGRDNWLDNYNHVLSRLLASLTDWHLWRHTYGAKTCRVKYAYYEIQTLNCQILKHVAFWTKRSTRVI